MDRVKKSKKERKYTAIALSAAALSCLIIYGILYSFPSDQQEVERQTNYSQSSKRVNKSAADNQAQAVARESSAIIVDLLKIAGMSEAEVSAILGEPTSSKSTKYGMKRRYALGETEIVFIHGKADWITINDLNGAPFSEAVLPFLGLKQQPATFSNDNVIRWENISGLLELSIFPSQESVDYAYIKVLTP